MPQSASVLVAVESVSVPSAVPRSIGVGERFYHPEQMETPGARPGNGLPRVDLHQSSRLSQADWRQPVLLLHFWNSRLQPAEEGVRGIRFRAGREQRLEILIFKQHGHLIHHQFRAQRVHVVLPIAVQR
jgi:hypothetical protein